MDTNTAHMCCCVQNHFSQEGDTKNGNQLGEREVETYFSFCIHFVVVFPCLLVVLKHMNVFLLLLIWKKKEKCHCSSYSQMHKLFPGLVLSL